jgi:hypothetical protein
VHLHLIRSMLEQFNLMLVLFVRDEERTHI